MYAPKHLKTSVKYSICPSLCYSHYSLPIFLHILSTQARTHIHTAFAFKLVLISNVYCLVHFITTTSCWLYK